MRSASLSAARTPATSAAIPANRGARLRPRRRAAWATASSRLAGFPAISGAPLAVARANDCRLRSQPFSRTDNAAPEDRSITRSSQARAQNGQAASRTSFVPPFVMSNRLLGVVVLDIGEALIRRRCAFERATGLAGLPLNHVFDSFGQFEILIGHALGGVVHQSHFNPGIGSCDVRMMPGGLRQMTHCIDHHQRALPAMCLVFPADPARLIVPMRQLPFQPRSCLVFAVNTFFLSHRKASPLR